MSGLLQAVKPLLKSGMPQGLGTRVATIKLAIRLYRLLSSMLKQALALFKARRKRDKKADINLLRTKASL